MNITQLKQGSLNGLRRQTNECIDNAYRKGYEDGKKEPREVTNVEDTNEYQIGFEHGKMWATEEYTENRQCYYDNGYDKGIEDLVHAMKVYFPLNAEERLYYFGKNTHVDTYAIESPKDLIGKAKVYEKKKKAEEETIKVGDEVIGSSDGKAIVTMVDYDNVMVVFEDGSSGELKADNFKKTGRHFDELEFLLNKLGDENND